jgi:hypothetical protein
MTPWVVSSDCQNAFRPCFLPCSSLARHLPRTGRVALSCSIILRLKGRILELTLTTTVHRSKAWGCNGRIFTIRGRGKQAWQENWLASMIEIAGMTTSAESFSIEVPASRSSSLLSSTTRGTGIAHRIVGQREHGHWEIRKFGRNW